MDMDKVDALIAAALGNKQVVYRPQMPSAPPTQTQPAPPPVPGYANGTSNVGPGTSNDSYDAYVRSLQRQDPGRPANVAADMRAKLTGVDVQRPAPPIVPGYALGTEFVGFGGSNNSMSDSGVQLTGFGGSNNKTTGTGVQLTGFGGTQGFADGTDNVQPLPAPGWAQRVIDAGQAMHQSGAANIDQGRVALGAGQQLGGAARAMFGAAATPVIAGARAIGSGASVAGGGVGDFVSGVFGGDPYAAAAPAAAPVVAPVAAGAPNPSPSPDTSQKPAPVAVAPVAPDPFAHMREAAGGMTMKQFLQFTGQMPHPQTAADALLGNMHQTALDKYQKNITFGPNDSAEDRNKRQKEASEVLASELSGLFKEHYTPIQNATAALYNNANTLGGYGAPSPTSRPAGK